MYSGKDLAELSGYTSRVYALLSSLHALDNEIYPKNPRPATLSIDEVSGMVMSIWQTKVSKAVLHHVGDPRQYRHRT